MKRVFSLTTHSPSKIVYAENIQTIRWNELKSNKTCFCCLRQKLEQVFICGHVICNVCVKIFGSAVLKSEDCYKLICILCQNGKLIAKLKPPTASVGILSIDRGSIHSVILLKFLSLFQDLVSSAFLIWDLFDFIINTSSGKKLCVLIYQAYYHPN